MRKMLLISPLRKEQNRTEIQYILSFVCREKTYKTKNNKKVYIKYKKRSEKKFFLTQKSPDVTEIVYK